FSHRVAYETLIEPFPQGLQSDHLCRNHPCVNPWHIEPVTATENNRRGLGNKGELDGITDRINQLPMTETRKAEEIKKANAHIAAINKGNPSPYDQTDPVAYFDLRRKIELDPLSVTEADLAAVVGLGKGRVEGKDSLRPDGTKKDVGFLGVLKEAGGKDVTEFSISTDLKQNGKIIDFPTMVPTLTEAEIDIMLNDIIPNNKEIPDSIVRKAEDHARKRIAEGKSVFFESKGGISISDYEKLLGMIEPDSPLKRPASTRAQAAIARLRGIETRGFEVEEIDIEIEGKYLRISNDMDDFILKNPDATDEQITKKGIELLAPIAERVTIGFFARMLSGIFGKDRPGGKFLEKAFSRDKDKTTVTMVSPEGKLFTVPTEKKQTFIDNGFTEE
ncbi:hypothetical protein LCGC14_2809600, partial [marine sediment metagenome]